MADPEDRLRMLSSRADELRERLTALDVRRRELAAERWDPAAGRATIEQGVTDARRAVFFADRAGARAAQASERLVRVHAAAAQVHDRVAALYEWLASGGRGDETWFRRRAVEHRTFARQERGNATKAAALAADEILPRTAAEELPSRTEDVHPPLEE